MVRTRVGYAGGAKENPTYKRLGDHTETVQVDYDPTRISYQDLLEVFWASHQPGSRSWSRQYMNVIFFENPEQQRLAEESKARVAEKIGDRVQTAILPATAFTWAEDYHQKYYLRMAPPLLQHYARVYPDLPELVNSTAAARVNGYLAGYGSVAQLQEELPDLGLSPEAGQQLMAYVAAKANPAKACPVPR